MAPGVRVFVSHNMEEAGALALRVVGDLEAMGATCWTASRDIPAGKEWPTAINEAFAESTHLLVLVGRSKPSGWVRRETAMGIERQVREEGFEVIPVVFEQGAELTDGLQVSQAVDIATDYAAGLRRLATRLGLGEGLPAHEARLLATWEQGLNRLRRQSEPLRRQLAAVRQAVKAERANSERRVAEAEAAAAAAKSARDRAAKLESQARSATTHAELATQTASQAAVEMQRAESVAAELSRRLAELEASHSPTLNQVEQAENVLKRARRDGALNVDRRDQVVRALEDPAQTPAAAETPETSSLNDFLHRHQVTEVILTAVEKRMTEDTPERDFVFSRCMQALASELPLSLGLSGQRDPTEIQELGLAIAEAIDRYLSAGERTEDAVALLDGELGVAFVRYAVKNAKPSQGVKEPQESEPRDVSSTSGLDTSFDVVLTGLAPNFRPWLVTSLAGALQDMSTRHPDGATVRGYIACKEIVTSGRFPSTVLKGVDAETAESEAAQLRRRGAEVSVRPTEDMG